MKMNGISWTYLSGLFGTTSIRLKMQYFRHVDLDDNQTPNYPEEFLQGIVTNNTLGKANPILG